MTREELLEVIKYSLKEANKHDKAIAYCVEVEAYNSDRDEIELIHLEDDLPITSYLRD